MSRHIDEFAELYALGSLEAPERAAVERHVRACVPCANRIRAAEETIAFIADLEEHHEPPRTVAESFAAKLAVSRMAQKLLSLKVIGTVLVIGLILLTLSFRATAGRDVSVVSANLTSSGSAIGSVHATSLRLR
jgi:anti-sigma factor RsiW